MISAELGDRESRLRERKTNFPRKTDLARKMAIERGSNGVKNKQIPAEAEKRAVERKKSTSGAGSNGKRRKYDRQRRKMIS